MSESRADRLARIRAEVDDAVRASTAEEVTR